MFLIQYSIADITPRKIPKFLNIGTKILTSTSYKFDVVFLLKSNNISTTHMQIF